MPAIAGICQSRTSGLRDPVEEVHKMLAAMNRGIPHTVQKHCSQSRFAAVGSSGSCAASHTTAYCVEKGSVSLHVVGEMYNRQAGEPSFVLDRYLKYGSPDFAKGLNGSFSAVILDQRCDCLLLVTDHVNSCPIFTLQHEGTLYFASEVKGLMALPELPCRPNVAMILSLLTSGQLMNHETIVEGVRQLDAATVCAVTPEAIRAESVWRFEMNDAPKDMGKHATAKAMACHLREAVARHVRNDTPTILLSGGIDSRTIVAFMGEDAKRVPAFTYTARAVAERHRYGDAELATQLANLVNMRHTLLEYKSDDILDLVRQTIRETDGAAMFLKENIWDMLHNVYAVNHVLMGDECFNVAVGPVRESHILEYLGLRSLDHCPSIWPYVRTDKFGNFLEISRSQCSRLFVRESGRPTQNILDELLHRHRLQFFHNPKRTMITRHGIKVRRPLVDLELLEFVQELPFKYRVGKLAVRQALRSQNRAVYALPRARTTENISYAERLRKLELDGGQVSEAIFRDNPLLEEIFDLEAIRGLIADVASASTTRRRGRCEGLLPPQLRRWLAAAARRHLRMHSPYMTEKWQRLLRIIGVSETLRHVNRRCQASI
jgi:hypothetical protein